MSFDPIWVSAHMLRTTSFKIFLFCLVVGGGAGVESREIIEIKCFLKSEK